MKRKTLIETKCKVCGVPVLSHSEKTMYCPDCKVKVLKIQRHQKAEEARKQLRELIAEQRKEERRASLREIVLEAEKRHMSYGQYVGLMEVSDGIHRV